MATLLWVGCADTGARHEVEGVSPTDPEGCRSFAALGSVRVAEALGDLACSFDPATRRHACKISAGETLVSTSAEYASTADFVEAGRYMAKVTSLHETRSEDGVVSFTTHHYDELGRLLRSRQERAGSLTLTTYTQYDDVGRPQRAVSSTPSQSEGGCAEVLVSIQYADRERTVSRRSRPADGSRCGFTERTSVEHYDGAGNRVSLEEAYGSGVATLYETGRGTKTDRVCL